MSLYECIQEYEELDKVIPLDVQLTGYLTSFKKEKLDSFKEELYTHFPTVIQLVGQPSEHPLKELIISFNGLTKRDRLFELLNNGRNISEELGKVRELLLSCLSNTLPDSRELLFKGLELLSNISTFPIVHPCILDTAFDVKRCKELEVACGEMKERDELYNSLIQDNRPEFFDEDVLSLLKTWSEIQGKWFLPKFFASRSFINKLKFFNKNIRLENVEDILENILRYQKIRNICASKETVIKEYTSCILSTEDLIILMDKLPILKDHINGFSIDAGVTVNELLAKLKESFSEDLLQKLQGTESLYNDWNDLITELSQIIQITWPDSDNFTITVSSLFNRWTDNISKIEKWFVWCELRHRLNEIGLISVVEATEKEIINPQYLADSFFKGLYKSIAEKKISSHHNLIAFEGLLFDQQVKVYKELTNEFQELSKKLLYSRLSTQIPQIYDDIDNNGELGLLLRNIANGARGMSIRQLLDSIPNLLPKLCPCMLMSPMSVAQYIDLSQDKFDLVVFDEASQMPTSEAVGAIARGKSLVVVGDPKQMPPTSFFSSNNIDEEDESIDDLESILQDCQALGIPSLQLNWHYRSRHESLIAFSNNEYYGGELITFPSTDDQKTKVRFVKINGVYEKGGKRCNRAEADAIVKEVVKRLKNETLRKDSIGIIAFSSTQQTLIEDLLYDTIELDKELTQYADSMYEPIFVKNLENVQGDERDVILFSIGYGPDSNGKISMNFGPLNKIGGERRLNVAVSRARKEMIVYSTMTGSQINLNNTKSKGVEGLKHFLDYAEKQILFEAARINNTTEQLSIQRQIANTLRSKGFEVKTEIGLSDFKIDIAVIDPRDNSNYILGILLDGETYLNTQTTRDREIVQPSVLKNLNWNVARVWSVDWFKQPDVVTTRIIELINELISEQDIHTEIVSECTSNEQSSIKSFSVSSEEVLLNMPDTKATDYPDINYPYCDGIDSYIDMVVKNEQPIMYTLLCKRVASHLNISRVTSKSQYFVDMAMKKYHYIIDRDNKVICENINVFNEWDKYRPNVEASKRRPIEDIPSIELEIVLIEIVKQNLSIPEDGLTLTAAKRMGFARRGSNVDAALNEVLSRLIEQNKLCKSDGIITLSKQK